MKRIAFALILMAAPVTAAEDSGDVKDCFAPGGMQDCVQSISLTETAIEGGGWNFALVGEWNPDENGITLGEAEFASVQLNPNTPGDLVTRTGGPAFLPAESGVYQYSGGAAYGTYDDRDERVGAETRSSFEMIVDMSGGGTMRSLDIGNGIFVASNLDLGPQPYDGYGYRGYFEEGRRLNFDIYGTGVNGAFFDHDVEGSADRKGVFSGFGSPTE